jgi:hypothetical protein
MRDGLAKAISLAGLAIVGRCVDRLGGGDAQQPGGDNLSLKELDDPSRMMNGHAALRD